METQLKIKIRNKKEGEKNKMKNILLRKNLKNNENGITLISLVVTIIVLLILASTSISMLSGNNGILIKATDTRINTIVAGEKEQLQLAIMASIETNGNLSIDILKSNIEKDIKDAKHDGTTNFPLTVTYEFGDTYQKHLENSIRCQL